MGRLHWQGWICIWSHWDKGSRPDILNQGWGWDGREGDFAPQGIFGSVFVTTGGRRDASRQGLGMLPSIPRCTGQPQPRIILPEVPLVLRGETSIKIIVTSSVQFSSVTQSCPTLCDPMNRSTPGLPVHHQLPEFTQTHIHRVRDAIQPSHPLLSRFPPAPNPSQHQSLFQCVNSSYEVAKVLEFQLEHHSFQRNPRADLLHNGLVGSPCSPRDSQESSPTPQFKSINS